MTRPTTARLRANLIGACDMIVIFCTGMIAGILTVLLVEVILERFV